MFYVRICFLLLFVFLLIVPSRVASACDEVPPSVPKSQPTTPQQPPNPPTEPSPSQPSIHPIPVVYNHSLQISEILPNPIGDDTANEFIELYNYSSQGIDLKDWKIIDASGKTFVIPSGNVSLVSSRGYVVLYRATSGIVLNNSGGDQVTFVDPNGEVVDSMRYNGSVVEGESFSLDSEGEWQWTSHVTPGQVNVFDETQDDDQNDTDTSKDDSDEKEKNNDSVVPNPNDDKDTDEGTPEDKDETEPSDEVPTDDDSEDETPAPEDDSKIQPVDVQARVFMNEIFPNPVGTDFPFEWIELWNQEDRSISLFGWQIGDTARTYVFPEDTTIAARSYFVVKQPEVSIALNNTGDAVSLTNPLGEVVDIITFPTDVTEGVSWARTSIGQWQWNTQPTPGQDNVFPQDIVQQDIPGADQALSGETPSLIDVSEKISPTQMNDTEQSQPSIAEIKELPLGSKVEFMGIVTAPPGVFHSDFFYVADETAGIQVAFSQGVWPEIVEGFTVRVIGELSEAHSEKKVNISNPESVLVVDSLPRPLLAKNVSIFTESEEGLLIQLQGILSERSRYQLLIDDQWIVAIKQKTQIDMSRFQQDDPITITGILTQQKDIYQLWPRYQSDLVSEESETQVIGATQPTSVYTTASQDMAGLQRSSQSWSMFFPRDMSSVRPLLFVSFFVGSLGIIVLIGYSMEKRWKFFSKRKWGILKH